MEALTVGMSYVMLPAMLPIGKRMWIMFVVCFLLGKSPASEFFMLTFRNTLFYLHRQVGMKND